VKCWSGLFYANNFYSLIRDDLTTNERKNTVLTLLASHSQCGKTDLDDTDFETHHTADYKTSIPVMAAAVTH
jgi:hypothetical protein